MEPILTFSAILTAIIGGVTEALAGKAIDATPGTARKIKHAIDLVEQTEPQGVLDQAVQRAVEGARVELLETYAFSSAGDEVARDVVALFEKYELFAGEVARRVIFEGKPDFEHLRKDHNQERYLMRVIRQAAAQRGLWTGEDLRHLKSVGQELVDFMRAHVDLENSKIYPVAMELLQGERGEQLTEAFQDFERARRSHGYDGFLNELAEELVRDYSGEQVA